MDSQSKQFPGHANVTIASWTVLTLQNISVCAIQWLLVSSMICIHKTRIMFSGEHWENDDMMIEKQNDNDLPRREVNGENAKWQVAERSRSTIEVGCISIKRKPISTTKVSKVIDIDNPTNETKLHWNEPRAYECSEYAVCPRVRFLALCQADNNNLDPVNRHSRIPKREIDVEKSYHNRCCVGYVVSAPWAAGVVERITATNTWWTIELFSKNKTSVSNRPVPLYRTRLMR